MERISFFQISCRALRPTNQEGNLPICNLTKNYQIKQLLLSQSQTIYTQVRYLVNDILRKLTQKYRIRIYLRTIKFFLLIKIDLKNHFSKSEKFKEQKSKLRQHQSKVQTKILRLTLNILLEILQLNFKIYIYSWFIIGIHRN